MLRKEHLKIHRSCPYEQPLEVNFSFMCRPELFMSSFAGAQDLAWRATKSLAGAQDDTFAAQLLFNHAPYGHPGIERWLDKL